MKGSQTTGQLSCRPNWEARTSLSASLVRGVMRSTMELGKAPFCSIQAAISGFFSLAKEMSMLREMLPFFCMLSQDRTVKGLRPAAWRRTRAS